MNENAHPKSNDLNPDTVSNMRKPIIMPENN